MYRTGESLVPRKGNFLRKTVLSQLIYFMLVCPEVKNKICVRVTFRIVIYKTEII